MNELSLPDGLLHQVAKPARYTGAEWNSTIKDWDKTKIKFALSYPDVYEIGMSNIALPILYDLLNSQADVLAERVFAPWIDMEALMRREGIPLFSLESGRPLKDFDVIGFSLGYELTYTNVLNMLDLAGIPVLASERDDARPLIIAGGSAALNPEPMSDFIDAFVLGDGEEVLFEILDVLRRWKAERSTKKELLKQLAFIPGVYVPGLYCVEYEKDGIFRSITPAIPEAPPSIQRRILNKLTSPPTGPVVPYIEVIHDRGAVEIQRGCSCGCRFCQAGMIYRPVRERSHEEVLQTAGKLVSCCGYDEVSLVSLNTSDYARVDDLVANLTRLYPNLNISLPSLRIDTFSIKLMGTLPTRGKTGLTFAPEAGSERLRQAINKDTTEEKLLETVSTALSRGWASFKLYFMVGLPTETVEDVEGIVQLVNRVRLLGKDSRRRPQLRVSVSTFVPKPHTPFQWAAQDGQDQLNEKQEILKRGLLHRGIKLSWQDPRVSLLEASLSRGDRRIGRVIYHAWKRGATFDAWTERFSYDTWLRAFAEAGLDPEFYARRERPLDEPLPWSHISIGVTDAFLKREHRLALEGRRTSDCRYQPCNACGLQRLSPDCQQKFSALKPAVQKADNQSD